MTDFSSDLTGKTVVIKLGGNVFTNGGSSLTAEVQALAESGTRIVIVHGGGSSIDAALKTKGIAPKKVNGLRITDAATLDVVVHVLDAANCLVSEFVPQCDPFPSARSCIKAFKAAPVESHNGVVVDLGFVGEVVGIDCKPLLTSLANGKVPVVAPIGFDSSGFPLNINADHAAAAIAAALGAAWLLLLSDVPGVLWQPRNPQSVLPHLSIDACKSLIADGTINGGMVPKVHTAITAVQAGVSNVVIADGLAEQAVNACLQRRRGTAVSSNPTTPYTQNQMPESALKFNRCSTD